MEGMRKRGESRTVEPDSDVHVTQEDQAKINRFAEFKTKTDDLAVEIQSRVTQLDDLEDLRNELVLYDADEQIPVLCGEIFIYMNYNDTVKAMETAKSKAEREIADLKETESELKHKMNNLKTFLYGRFGNRINLENDS